MPIKGCLERESVKHRSLDKRNRWRIGIIAIVLCHAFVGGTAVPSEIDSKNPQRASPATETLYQEGLAYRQKQDYRVAAEKLSQAITRGKKTADAYTYLGEVYIRLDRHDEAHANLSEAIRLDRESVRAYSLRAIALEQLGKSEEAIQDYSAALAGAPQELKASLLEARGNTYWALNQLEKAAADFEKIIAHDPRGARGYVLRGKLLGAKGKYREALDDFSSALARDARRKVPHFYRGFVYGCLKEYEKALHDYTALIQAVPEAAIVHAYRGWIQNRLENHHLAEADLTYALEHGYRQPFVYLYLAYSLAAQNQIDRALKVNNEVVSLDQGEVRVFVEAYFQRGDFLLMKKQYDQARSFYEKGIAVAKKLGLRSVLSRAFTDLKRAFDSDVEMRQGGNDILRLLEESVSRVQPNPLYDKPSSCELESPAPTADQKGILNQF